MKKLFVFADFDWLDGPTLVGELGYESLRGSDSYSFKFANQRGAIQPIEIRKDK